MTDLPEGFIIVHIYETGMVKKTGKLLNEMPLVSYIEKKYQKQGFRT